MNHRIVQVCLMSSIVVLGNGYTVRSATVYWVEAGSPSMILRADTSGRNIQMVASLPGLGPYTAIALDWPAGKIFFSTGFASQLHEVNVNGANNQSVDLNEFSGAEYITVDVSSETVYWSNVNRLEYLTPADSMPQLLLFGETMKDVSVDTQAKRIYWGEYHVEVSWCKEIQSSPCHCLHRAGVDGSDATSLHCESTIESFRDIEVLPAANSVFWLNPAQYEIRRSDLDGGDVQVALDVFDGLGQVETFAVDPFREKIHWIAFVAGSGYWFFESELEGSQVRPVFRVPTVSTARSMVLDPRPAGDIDFDGKTDLSDFAAFQNCMGTDFSGATGGCAFFDVVAAFEGLDTEDFAEFESVMNGP